MASKPKSAEVILKFSSIVQICTVKGHRLLIVIGVSDQEFELTF